jgi:hypothetical protein
MHMVFKLVCVHSANPLRLLMTNALCCCIDMSASTSLPRCCCCVAAAAAATAPCSKLFENR